MAIAEADILRIAELLDTAAETATPMPLVTSDWPALDVADAYRVQRALRARKQQRGQRISGFKAGLTSQDKMRQMGVNSPVFGFLTAAGAYSDGAAIRASRFIHPRVEPEIAIVTRSALRGPSCNIAAVLAAIDCVIPAVEIIDSRYVDFVFDLPGVIADNTSAAGHVIGSRKGRIAVSQLPTLGVVVEKNGEIVQLGAAAAVLGHPAAAVVALVNLLARTDEHLPAGSFVMTGGITAAVAVRAGDCISVRYQHLGTVSMRFV